MNCANRQEGGVILNIHEFLAQAGQYKDEFFDSCCMINRNPWNLDQVQKMGYAEFGARSQISMPLKLYKYFSDAESNEGINFSRQALQTNEVYLNAPDKFDDVFDSEIVVEPDEYYFQRIKRYAKLCGIDMTEEDDANAVGYALAQKFYHVLKAGKELHPLFSASALPEGERKSFEIFLLQVQIYVMKDSLNPHSAIAKAIHDEYNSGIKNVRRAFRVSCFADTPYSQLMWGGSYANNHRGFCLEYTVLPNDPEYSEIYHNLFPVIYSKVRGNLAETIFSNYQNAVMTEQDLWEICFNGVLRKSIDWLYQNEWRLLLPGRGQEDGFTIPFFPITKVFLGNRMSVENRKAIIDICHQRSIPFTGVMRVAERFEMQPCPVLCEQCAKLTNDK